MKAAGRDQANGQRLTKLDPSIVRREVAIFRQIAEIFERRNINAQSFNFTLKWKFREPHFVLLNENLSTGYNLERIISCSPLPRRNC